MKQYFTLHQKRSGQVFQACCYFKGEIRWVSTDTANRRQAGREAMAMQPEILVELGRRAALKGSNLGPNHADQNVSAAGLLSITPNVWLRRRHKDAPPGTPYLLWECWFYQQ